MTSLLLSLNQGILLLPYLARNLLLPAPGILLLLQEFSSSSRNSPTPPRILLILLQEFFYSSSRNCSTPSGILILLIQEFFYSSFRISFSPTGILLLLQELFYSSSRNSSTPHPGILLLLIQEFLYCSSRNSSTPNPGILLLLMKFFYSSSISRSSNDSLIKLIHGVFFILLVTSVFSSFTINSRTLTNASIRWIEFSFFLDQQWFLQKIFLFIKIVYFQNIY